MTLFKRENMSALNVVTYCIVQSWALKIASKKCIHPAWMRDHAITERKSTCVEISSLSFKVSMLVITYMK